MIPAAPQSGPVVTCPGCRQSVLYSPQNRWRPFCSERCRNGDLGAWASERYRVAEGEFRPDAADEAGDIA